MIAHFLQEVLALIIEFIRHIVQLFVQALGSLQGLFFLALMAISISGAIAAFSPDLSFLGVPGLVHLSDVQTVGASAIVFSIFLSLFRVFLSLWWLWIFFLLFEPVRELWIHYRQCIFKSSIKWTLWELKMPRLVTQTPEAMDQVFVALHAFRNSAGNLPEIYIDGELTRWFTFEIVSFEGEVRFYMRGYTKQKNLIESTFFSYYQDVELVQLTPEQDYMNKIPKTVAELYTEGKDMYGGEMLLSKPDAYPIKTYPKFETPDPEKRLDPISTILELFGKLKTGEFMAIQINAAPADKSWFKEFAPLLKKLKKPEEDEFDEKKGKFSFNVRTPGETEVLEAVERNLAKPAYDTVIRLLYISPKETFLDTIPRNGIISAFNQYGMLDLNSFRRNEDMTTKAQIWDYPHVFPAIRAEYKKQRLLYLFRNRDMPAEKAIGKWYNSYFFNSAFSSKSFKLNTEALATLFHPPTEFVLTAPHLQRVESRKAGAPAGLAIYAEEDAIDKFYSQPKK